MTSLNTTDMSKRLMLLGMMCVASASTISTFDFKDSQNAKQREKHRSSVSTSSSDFTGVDMAAIGAAGFLVSPSEPIWRPTSQQELTIAEIRSFSRLSAGWDGEGGLAPNEDSLVDACAFVCHLRREDLVPEPMLHSSGRAGLYWGEVDLYADLEFLGGGRIAYYIERGADKHKGVVTFDGKHIPDVFKALVHA